MLGKNIRAALQILFCISMYSGNKENKINQILDFPIMLLQFAKKENGCLKLNEQ